MEAEQGPWFLIFFGSKLKKQVRLHLHSSAIFSFGNYISMYTYIKFNIIYIYLYSFVWGTWSCNVGPFMSIILPMCFVGPLVVPGTFWESTNGRRFSGGCCPVAPVELFLFQGIPKPHMGVTCDIRNPCK